MTFEKRVLISPDEIVGLEIECRRCRARYAMELASAHHLPFQCHNCSAKLISAEATEVRVRGGVSQEALFLMLVDVLQGLRELGGDAVVRLQLKGEIFPAS